MLNAHPRVYIPEESDFIPYFFLGKPHKKLSNIQIAQMLDIIFTRYRFVNEWQGERPDVIRFTESMPEKTPAAFLDRLYSMYAEQNEAERWGDKTPIYASYLDLIKDIFPNAKFIHIVRDGRDAALSMLEKYEKDEFHVDVYFSARNWVRRIRDIQISSRALESTNYYEVRYEDLVRQPESELRAICSFIGETYQPAMVDHHNMAIERISADSHFFSSVREPVNENKIGKWRSDLAVRDQRLIQFVQGPLLDELDYHIEYLGKMRFSERVRYYLLKMKYVVLQAGRRVLQAIGLFPPI